MGSLARRARRPRMINRRQNERVLEQEGCGRRLLERAKPKSRDLVPGTRPPVRPTPTLHHAPFLSVGRSHSIILFINVTTLLHDCRWFLVYFLCVHTFSSWTSFSMCIFMPHGVAVISSARRSRRPPVIFSR